MEQTIQNVLEILASWWEMFLSSLPQLIIAILIFLMALYIGRVVNSLVERGLQYRQADPEIAVLVSRIARWSVITLGILLAADQAGVDITAILTGLGIVGFTIGFALQDVSKNFIAGILLLILQPFDLGDTIEVAGYTGTVLQVDLRATEMMAVDGRRVTIPNADIFTQSLINYTRSPKRRHQISVGVAYDSDLEFVRQTALEVIHSIPGVLEDPAPDFRFETLGDYAINFTVFYWYEESETGYSDSLDAGIVGIKDKFESSGIVMPVPAQTVYVKQ